jgi:hypothetical protein
MKKTYLYTIIVIAILAVILVGYAFFSPVGNMMCGPCGCRGEDCTCTPGCAGKVCGSDGCGGSCGTCPSPYVCSANGQCVCTPNCIGKACGSNGCGGSCGTCPANQTCNANGQCVIGPANCSWIRSVCGSNPT